MKAKIRMLLFCFAIFAIAFSAKAAVVSEMSFESLGYDDFLVEETEKENCFEVFFDIPEEVNLEHDYYVLTINAAFSPIGSADSHIKIFLNEQQNPLKVLEPIAFKTGKYRLTLPKNELRRRNLLKICAKAAIPTKSVLVEKNSIIGAYKMADFLSEGAFQLIPDTYRPAVGEEFRLKVLLKNLGSEAANVEVIYKREALEEKLPEFVFVRGNPKIGKELKAYNYALKRADQVEFEYVVKAMKSGQYTLLPAVARYVDTFGEFAEVESNRPQIIVVEPQRRLKAYISSEDRLFDLSNKIGMTVILKNDSVDTLKHVQAFLRLPAEVTAATSQLPAIKELKAGETTEIKVKLAAEKSGTYKIGCGVEYFVGDKGERSECDDVMLTLEEKGADYALLVVVGFILIGLIAYFFIAS